MHKVMFISRMWSCVCIALAIIICSTLYHVSNATQAALVGTVYCDTCFNRELFGSTHFISGALVAVECGDDGIQSSDWKPRFRKEVNTDGKGKFKVTLPFSAIEHVNVIKGCSVNLISSSESECAVAATTASTPIRLKIKTPEYHVFSAGFFTFQPLVQPRQCQTKTRNQNSRDEFSASATSPVDRMLHSSMDLSPNTSPIPPVTSTQITMELYHLADEYNFGFPYLQHQFLPPPLEPSLQFQSPPDFMFNPGLQPPPDSMFNLGLQPPPDTTLNPGFQPPANSMFNPGFQPPPDSMANPGLQAPPDLSTSNPGLQPPPDSIFNPDFQPPPDSILDPIPLQPPPDSTNGPFQTSPPTSTPQVSTPPPSGPFSPLEPQPNSTQSLPSPPSVSLPPFPFLPGSGMPGKPPATSSANMKKTSP